MISASEIHELRFEKAAFGYKQEPFHKNCFEKNNE